MAGGARHKVIQVSLQQDVKLHTAENAWKPQAKKDSGATDDDDALATQVLLCVSRSVRLYMLNIY